MLTYEHLTMIMHKHEGVCMSIRFGTAKENGKIIGFGMIFEGEDAVFTHLVKEAFLTDEVRVLIASRGIKIHLDTLNIGLDELFFKWTSNKERNDLEKVIIKGNGWRVWDLKEPENGFIITRK